MAPKRKISYIKPEEPAFIKRMKEKMGYQEPDTIETKREIAAYEEDTTEKDDEKPVIVTLKPGDLTEDEFNAITEKDEGDKKIMFSKPQNKESEKNSLDFSSKKKEDLQKKLNSQKGKQVKNASLLSFDVDEDED